MNLGILGVWLQMYIELLSTEEFSCTLRQVIENMAHVQKVELQKVELQKVELQNSTFRTFYLL